MKTKRTLSGFMWTFLLLALMMYIIGYIGVVIISGELNLFKWIFPESIIAIIFFSWVTVAVAWMAWFNPSLFKSKEEEKK